MTEVIGVQLATGLEDGEAKETKEWRAMFCHRITSSSNSVSRTAWPIVIAFFFSLSLSFAFILPTMTFSSHRNFVIRREISQMNWTWARPKTGADGDQHIKIKSELVDWVTFCKPNPR
jgi:hypothetical protein